MMLEHVKVIVIATVIVFVIAIYQHFNRINVQSALVKSAPVISAFPLVRSAGAGRILIIS